MARAQAWQRLRLWLALRLAWRPGRCRCRCPGCPHRHRPGPSPKPRSTGAAAAAGAPRRCGCCPARAAGCLSCVHRSSSCHHAPGRAPAGRPTGPRPGPPLPTPWRCGPALFAARHGGRPSARQTARHAAPGRRWRGPPGGLPARARGREARLRPAPAHRPRRHRPARSWSAWAPACSSPGGATHPWRSAPAPQRPAGGCLSNATPAEVAAACGGRHADAHQVRRMLVPRVASTRSVPAWAIHGALRGSTVC